MFTSAARFPNLSPVPAVPVQIREAEPELVPDSPADLAAGVRLKMEIAQRSTEADTRRWRLDGSFDPRETPALPARGNYVSAHRILANSLPVLREG